MPFTWHEPAQRVRVMAHSTGQRPGRRLGPKTYHLSIFSILGLPPTRRRGSKWAPSREEGTCWDLLLLLLSSSLAGDLSARLRAASESSN